MAATSSTRANSRYAEIARKSLRENQPAFYAELERNGELERFLAKRAKEAEDMATRIHQQNLANGVQPGVSAAEADSQAIRDNLLFPSPVEQDDAYQNPSPVPNRRRRGPPESSGKKEKPAGSTSATSKGSSATTPPKRGMDPRLIEYGDAAVKHILGNLNRLKPDDQDES